MAKHITDADRELLAMLGVDTTPAQQAARTPREERTIAGFEEIERFVDTHGRLPQHGEDRDIFERRYAVRLDSLRASDECRALLGPLDARRLLAAPSAPTPAADADDEALLAELGVAAAGHEVTQLTHVRSHQEIKAAEEIAQRTPCPDFERFAPLFEQVQQDLRTGARRTLKYQDNAAVNAGDWFVLDGQKVLVAEMGAPFVTDYGRQDRRLRVVYDNATESDLLLRSLQRALNKDKASRRITTPDLGPLFGQEATQDDQQTGNLYVLRSQSDDPFVAKHRALIHKIGVTGGDVNRRIANARRDPTYLLADVEVVANFKLANINRVKLEGLLHQFFGHARLHVALADRFGTPVQAREWFFVPLGAIEAAVEKLQAGTLHQFRYDPEKARLVEA